MLLHPTSLPSAFGIGDLGPSAYNFVDFLQAAGQTLWQVLPLVVPDVVGSPYASSSAFAGNWLLISPELLVRDKFLPSALPSWSESNAPVHFPSVAKRKLAMLAVAFEHFQKYGSVRQRQRLDAFSRSHQWWLRDFALFATLKERFGLSTPWTRWPLSIRQRRPAALRAWRKRLRRRIAFHEFEQWLVHEQWTSLKRYANAREIQIIGDLPLFVTRDSADTWSDPKNFMLDHLGRPRLVAGVPPDYFSRRGQVWGDPLYDWKHIQSEHFQWWIERFRRSFELFDVVRLDHFRGYVATWGVRAKSKSSRHGSWHEVPGRQMFAFIQKKFPRSQFIAEDLGVITPEVIGLRNTLGFPGVRVLQFGFDDLGSVHALGNISRRSVLYTGTHDNNTTRGWFGEDAQRHERRNILKFFHATEKTVAWNMVSAAYRSRANTVIVPLQDLLNLGSTARMNTPGTRQANWQWRFSGKLLTKKLTIKIRRLVKVTKR